MFELGIPGLGDELYSRQVSSRQLLTLLNYFPYLHTENNKENNNLMGWLMSFKLVI